MSKAQPKPVELTDAHKALILRAYTHAANETERLAIVQAEAQSATLMFNIECRRALGELGLLTADGWHVEVSDGEVTLAKKAKEPTK